MKINKRCLSAFSRTKPFLALGSKSKLFDTTFSLTSELSLYDYSIDKQYPTLQLDRKFSKLLWCEKNEKSILATGHDNGMISLYEPDLEGSSFKILSSFSGLEGDVLGMDFNVSKNVIAAGSANGKIIFWNLDKIDQQYECGIAIQGNITTLAWNKKVSRILCAGTDKGSIHVLDLRAKNIAMTLKTPDINTVSNLAWHPNCPTSIFASTDMNCLHMFNLSTDSMTTIGEHRVLGFDVLNNETLAAYSNQRIDYIDIDTLEITGHEEVDGLFETSFSHRDPLYCLSSSSGFTTVSSRRSPSLALRNSQAIFENHLISASTYKIEYPKLNEVVHEDVSHTLMKLLYQSGKFNLTDSNRMEVANLLYESFKDTKTNEMNLNDPLVECLVKHDFDRIQSGSKLIDLKFVIDLLQKKNIKVENNLIDFFLYLYATGKYEEVVEFFNSTQWKLMVSILLFSCFPIEKCIECFKEIEKKIPEDKEMIFMLTNNPKEILNVSDTAQSVPKSIFELSTFFAEFIPMIEKIKAFRIETKNEYFEEFWWFARDHGLYDLVKDLPRETSKEKSIDSKLDGLTLNSRTHQSKDGFKSLPKKTLSPSNQLYSHDVNKSVSSFTAVADTPRVSLPRGNLISRQNLRPPVVTSPPHASTSIGSQTIPKPTGFITRPPVKPSLYSCSSSGSTPNVIGKSRQFNVPGTYGSENSSVSTPGTPPLPQHGIKAPMPRHGQPFPKPFSPPSMPSKPIQPTPIVEKQYDNVGLSAEFEKVYERLRDEASKKNNLIIGNKIKDANRRFSVFQNIDKSALSNIVLDKMNLIIQTFRDVSEKNLLKQSVKMIVEDCSDIHENQCNIWMPSVFILVQLVY